MDQIPAPAVSRELWNVLAQTSINFLCLSAYAYFGIWFALEVTHSVLDAGLVDGIWTVPQLLAFAVGAWADRLKCRKSVAIMIVGSRVPAVLAFILALDAQPRLLKLAVMMGASAYLGFAQVASGSIRSIWIRGLTRTGQFSRVVSFQAILQRSLAAIGIVIPGLLFLTGLEVAAVGVALLFGTALVPLTFFAETATATTTPGAPPKKIASGFQYLVRSRLLRQAYSASLTLALVFGMIGLIEATLVALRFDLSALFYSGLGVASSISMAVGAYLGHHWKRPMGLLVPGMFVAMGGLYLLLVPFLFYAVLVLLAVGLGLIYGFVTVPLSAVCSEATPPEFAGSIGGAYGSLLSIAVMTAPLLAGVLLTVVALNSALLLVGLAAIGCGLATMSHREMAKATPH